MISCTPHKPCLTFTPTPACLLYVSSLMLMLTICFYKGKKKKEIDTVNSAGKKMLDFRSFSPPKVT